MDEVAVNLKPERLPVILEEDETAVFDETITNELNNEREHTPAREDNLLQEVPTEAAELPALVITRSGRVRKQPAKLRDHV